MNNKTPQHTFYQSLDFLKLGQSINRGQWQSASMIIRRMEQKAAEAEITEFTRQFTGLRQCINRKNKEEAKQILAVVINKRARFLNEASGQRNIES